MSFARYRRLLRARGVCPKATTGCPRDRPPRTAGVDDKVNSFAITGDTRTPDAPETAKLAWSRSNFLASGWAEEDLLKPIVTVAAPYSNNMPCNNQHRELAGHRAEEELRDQRVAVVPRAAGEQCGVQRVRRGEREQRRREREPKQRQEQRKLQRGEREREGRGGQDVL